MTPGSDPVTIDGLNLQFFKETAEKVRAGKYEFTPARIQEIPKANGKIRQLGINSPREKIIQKALEMVLSSVWEPLFDSASHGFRPNRSVKTALFELFKHGDNFS